MDKINEAQADKQVNKIDEIQAKIKKQEDGLWDLEDDYKAAKKKLEDSYWELEDNNLQLMRLYEEFGDVAYHFSRQGQVDEEGRRHFLDLLDTYASETDMQYRCEREEIEEKDDELEKKYKKDRRQLEDDLEKNYSLRRKLYEEEEGEKK